MSVVVAVTPPSSPTLPRHPDFQRRRASSAGPRFTTAVVRLAAGTQAELLVAAAAAAAAVSAAAAAAAATTAADAEPALLTRRRCSQELSPRAAQRGLLGEARAAAAAEAAATAAEPQEGGNKKRVALPRRSGSFTVDEVHVENETPSRYAIHECCGKGAFGDVYRATDTREKAIVAIKFVSRTATRPWRVEASIGDRLSHPNIVRMLDHYVHGGFVGLVYEYAPDMDLFDWIVGFHHKDPDGTVGFRTPGVASLVVREAGVQAALQSALATCDRLSDVDDAASVIQSIEVCRDCVVLPLTPGAKEIVGRHIARQLVSALEYCHQLGTSHMDLKPENVRIRRSDLSVKILDFGMGAVYWDEDDTTIEGGVYGGSPDYAAPEILRMAKKVDTHIADMWSFGSTLFCVIHGYRAYSVVLKNGHFQTTHWQHTSPILSTECIEFLRGLLRDAPEKRITAQAAAHHPWIIGETIRTDDDGSDSDSDSGSGDTDVDVDTGSTSGED